MRAIILGLLASFFFASSFVLNRLMSTDGGSWVWSASLRYLFMLPMLFILVGARKRLPGLFQEMRLHPWRWMIWSLIGFGLFYAPLCFAADYSPAWVVAGTWQLTIVAGSLLVPFFRETVQTPNGPLRVRGRVPRKAVLMSCVILAGIYLMEWSQSSRVSIQTILLGVIPVAIGAVAYPLGNRQMMELCQGRLDAVSRTLGMTIASLPLWIVLSLYQGVRHGLPTTSQTLHTFVVAVFSGVIATILFFTATDIAKGNSSQLAAVEATQAGEVVFTLLGERMFIPGTTVSHTGIAGFFLVVTGMILHSLTSSHGKKPRANNNDVSREDVTV